MKGQLTNLLNRIQRWHSPVLQAEIAQAPEPIVLPVPQITWTLLALAHYLHRKLWAWRTLAGEVLPEVRGREYRGIGGCRTLQRRECGIVPGTQEWNYTLAGENSCLTNRATGECLQINLYSGAPVIKSSRFVSYMRKRRSRGVAGQRLGELFPSGGYKAAINQMKRCGVFLLLEAIDGDVRSLRMDDSVVQCSEAIQAFLQAWGAPENRITLACLIGDWPALGAAAASGGQAELAACAEALAEQARRRWIRLLRTGAECALCDSTRCALAD